MQRPCSFLVNVDAAAAGPDDADGRADADWRAFEVGGGAEGKLWRGTATARNVELKLRRRDW